MNKNSNLPTEYQLFAKKEIPRQRELHPGLESKEYMKLAAVEWKKQKAKEGKSKLGNINNISNNNDNLPNGRQPTEYQLFAKKEIPRQRELHPGLESKEYMKLAAEEWAKYKMKQAIVTKGGSKPKINNNVIDEDEIAETKISIKIDKKYRIVFTANQDLPNNHFSRTPEHDKIPIYKESYTSSQIIGYGYYGDVFNSSSSFENDNFWTKVCYQNTFGYIKTQINDVPIIEQVFPSTNNTISSYT